MKITKYIITVSVLLWLSACSTLSVNYDFNPKVDFSHLKTYNWIAFPKDMPANELERARFITAVENNLFAKGIVKNTDKPDFLIATHFGIEKKVDINNWGYSYSPGNAYTGYGYGHAGYGNGYAPGGGVSTYRYEQGTLILDFVATEGRQLIWRATAKAVLAEPTTPEKETENINDAVKEILASFPPQKGTKAQ